MPSKLNKIRTNKAMWTGPKKKERSQMGRRKDTHAHRDTGYWILDTGYWSRPLRWRLTQPQGASECVFLFVIKMKQLKEAATNATNNG